MSRRSDAPIALGVGAFALTVYAVTLLPGTGYSGDTAKWQMLGVVGGVPHPTGYPLYVALDQAWVTVVPVGSAAWRVNLLSAVLGAAAVGVLYVLLRILDVRPVVAAAGALVFAFSGTFWSQAVVAEVYTLHVLFLVTVTACLAHWRTGAANGWLLAGLGLYALSFGNHLTSIVALPGVAWIVWSDRRRALRWGNAAFVAAAGLLGAGQYLYLVHLSDAAPYREAQIDSLGDVAAYVTGGDFKDAMFAFGPRALLVDRVPLVLDYLALEYSVLLVPMAAGIVRGLWRLPAAPRAAAVQLALLAVGTAVYVLNYDVPDLVVFFLPLFFPLAAFLAIGLEGAVRWLEARPWASPWALRAGAGALAVLVVLFAAVNRSGSSQQGEVAVAERTERAIDAAGSDAVLLTDDYNESEYLWYYLLGEGLGEERNLVVADQVTPGEVTDYFSSASGPVAVAAETLGVAAPALYTGARRQARDLAGQGLAVTPLGDGVWRVGPPAAG
jgi:Protein O-mannosyl-transferase TMEM260-like